MQKTVVLKKCNEYEFDLVKEKLKECFEMLGGIQNYINREDIVLLKVNLLMKKKPEEATTTHPIFVEALAKIIIEYGAKVVIGDSPGGPFNKNILNTLYKVTGIEEAALKSGASLNFNVDSFTLQNPSGKLLKKFTATDMLNDVTKVISVSKLKTHGMMTFTGAVKNMFGIVPGLTKAEFHVTMPKYEDFASALVDICHASNPILSFMDGIVGMEGAGPSAGDSRKVNVILASNSPYELDKVACKIINLDFKKVPTIIEAEKRNFASLVIDDINILGEHIDTFRINDFKIPETALASSMFNLPKPLKKFFTPKPVFLHESCISCGICKENCPAEVIDMDSNNKPIVNLEDCIKCFCCQELCPKKAVIIHKPLLLKLLTKL